MELFVEQIDRELVALSWRLWSTLGVEGNCHQHPTWLIALEELIILTAILSESDPRLRDESLDWCSKFHYFVSVSRLRTLVKELGEQVYVPFSIFAETLNSISQSKWPVFVKSAPLRVLCSGKSQPPSCDLPALLGLRLRALFGVGARADLATFFLTQRSDVLTAADMVEIGYNKRTLADALDSFVQSGLLTCSMVRNQKRYEPVRRDQLASLAGELPKIVPDWRSILMLVVTLRSVLRNPQNKSIPSKVVAARNAMEGLTGHLHQLTISPPELLSDPALYWDSFVQWAVDTVKILVSQGNCRGTSAGANHFEETVASLMENLYRVDDCIDGLDFIVSCAQENAVRHQKIFKECYQISICYLYELKTRLEDLLQFPIHLFMDVSLSEVMYRYSKETRKSFVEFVEKSPPLDTITHAGVALNWYMILERQLHILHRFIYEIKKRLKELYSLQTNAHLLTHSSSLHKRHTVLSLYGKR